MTDVFISYASEDRDRAAKLADALAANGWSVWWDRRIIAGQAFDHAIEQALESAKTVVVLWSERSIVSEWVKNEAAVGAQRGVLVPAKIDAAKLPLAFRRKQTADMMGWDGDSAHPGFHSLCEGIGALLAPGRPLPPVAVPPRRNVPWWWTIVALLATILGIAVYLNKPTKEIAIDAPRSPESPQASTESSAPKTSLADTVVGAYSGGVTSDSKGGSLSDVNVTITRIDSRTVRVASDYARLGTVDVTLSRAGDAVLNAGGDTPFVLDLAAQPPKLTYSPRNELSYSGEKQ